LIPILYLKGISTGGFEEALAALLGQDAGGLSASTIGRLKDAWADEQARWQKRDLSVKRYVYFWADGIHVRARLEDDAQCLLVIIGATPEGNKELVGLIDGVRESAQSWKGLLLDLKRRGLVIGPELAVADGALGFWQAIEEVWPKTRGQRCWVHLSCRNRGAPARLHPQMAAQMQSGSLQSRRGRRPAVHLHRVARQPMEECAHHQRHRTASRGVQTPHQDPDSAALSRDRSHVILGAARRWSDHHAQSRRMADIDTQASQRAN
jgi:hypothetical protein